MRKIISMLGLFAIVLAFSPVMGQRFDTTAYKAHYKERLANAYYAGNFTTADKIAGLSKAWAEAKFGFANFDLVPHLDWGSLFHAYIPKVAETESPVAYYRLMMNLYQHLRDGHSFIFPPQSLWDDMFSVLPVRCQLMEGKVLITDVYSADYPILEAGQQILRINGQSGEDYARTHISPYMSFSTP